MPFFSNKYKLGLDIGSTFIKVCLPRRGGKPLVARMLSPEGAVTKGVLQTPEVVCDALKMLVKQQKLQNNQVVATLPASTLVLRHIQVPIMKPKETADAVEWEARRVLPFAVEEAQMDWVQQGTKVTEEGEMQDILLVAVRDSTIERYTDAVRESGLRLVALDVAPMALGRWLLKDSNESTVIIDLGAETTQLHFFESTKLVFSRSLSIGGLQATKAIQAATERSFEEAEIMKLRGEYSEEWLESWHSELARELQRSLEYYRSNYQQEGDQNFDQVLLTGGASSTRGVEALIGDVVGVQARYAEFASKLRTPRSDKIMYNVALGAGLWEGK
ncbi:MAG: type IV pilus assembly protein PilM [Firmicutes bacterium]|nr:type IV pilus assembly protein PilM [Bacillota bacterium]